MVFDAAIDVRKGLKDRFKVILFYKTKLLPMFFGETLLQKIGHA